jgi:hypothetical protein
MLFFSFSEYSNVFGYCFGVGKELVIIRAERLRYLCIPVPASAWVGSMRQSFFHVISIVAIPAGDLPWTLDKDSLLDKSNKWLVALIH